MVAQVISNKNKTQPSHTKAPSNLKPHPVLYQINTWAWLDEISTKIGRQIQLAEVPDAEWDQIQSLGFDIVYLMGIWQRSHAGRRLFRTDSNAFKVFDHALPNWQLENVVGSPFSIADYQPDPHIGDWNQLDIVRAKLHARNIRLMLDFVPNHTGPDHHWLISHPEFFLQGAEEDFHRDPNAFHLMEPADTKPYFVARGRDPYFAPWADTAQLDFYNQETRAALVSVLQNIGQHCDGLRCDMAMLVLNDIFGRTWQHLLQHRAAPPKQFWEEAIASLPSDFIWMAEVYWDMEQQLQNLGFTFTYDKRLYDRLCNSPAKEVITHLSAEKNFQSHMARFIENHDERRCTQVFGAHTLTAFATLIATLPGLSFFHQGQFEGKTIHLPMPLNQAAKEKPDSELIHLYTTLLNIAKDPVFHDSDWQLLETQHNNDQTHEHLIAYRWKSSTAYRLIVVNLNHGISHGRLFIADDLPHAAEHRLIDLLNGEYYERPHEDIKDNGLYIRLDSYNAHIFELI